jgi:hypothetical protein
MNIPIDVCDAQDVCEILRTEANQLARHLDDKDFGGMNHRVVIAVETEMRRLRNLEGRIKANIPRPPEDE